MSKKFSTFLGLLCAVLAAGCMGSKQSDSVRIDELKAIPWEITLTAEDVTAEGLTLICDCTAEAGWEVSTGSMYEMFVLQEDAWVPYERTDGQFGFTAWESIAYIVSAQSPTIWELDWTWLHGRLPAGEYRLVKTFAVSAADGRDTGYEEFRKFISFEIE